MSILKILMNPISTSFEGYRNLCFSLLTLVVLSALPLCDARAQSGAEENPQIQLTNGAKIDLDLGQPVTIEADSGHIIATSEDPEACLGTTSVCPEVQVDLPVLSQTPDSVSQGESMTVSWESRGAYRCEAEGLPASTGWTGTELQPVDELVIQTTTLAPDNSPYTATLTCSNGSTEKSKTFEFSVTGEAPGDPPAACPDNRSAASLSRDSTVVLNSSASVSSWNAFFGLDYPGGVTQDLRISPRTYAALEFNSGPADSTRRSRVEFFDPQGTASGGDKIISVARCPGDFFPPEAPLAADCRTAIGGGTFAFSVGGAARCDLEPNTDYYLNIVYTRDSLPGLGEDIQWVCNGAPTNVEQITECANKIDP